MAGKFSFMPGALFSSDHSGLGVYIKYGRPKGLVGDKIEIVDRSSWHLWLKTPDRELLIVRDGYFEHQTRPLDCNFDEFIALDPLRATANSFNSEHYMVNYWQHLEKPRSNFYIKQNLPRDKRSFDITSDSGGFQIQFGHTEFLNPEHIAQWYHENVDIGMAMDIPIPGGDPELLSRSSKLQVLNNNLMLDVLESKKSTTSLMNVSHGISLKQHTKFHEAIYTDRIDRLAISGLYRTSIVEALDMANGMLNHTKGQYKHYHFLGIYNIAILPALILMANQKNIPLVTSDASTALQSAMGRMYHLQKLPDAPVERLIIGTKGSKNAKAYLDPNKLLPCSCPVCSSLKYMDIFSTMNGAIVYFLLMLHNMFEISRYSNYMQNMAAQLPFEDYKELVSGQLRNHGSKKESLHALDYVNVANKESTQVARKKYYAYFQEISLFKQSHVMLGEPEITEPNVSLSERIKHVTASLSLYEKWHLSRENGVTIEVKKKPKDKAKNEAKASGTMFSKKKRMIGDKKAKKKKPKGAKKSTNLVGDTKLKV